jgi:hypothetical protein
LAKKEDLLGASKVALFAYHRETRLPVWQSGISVATSNARDGYILGMGPIQNGTIYHGTHFAGSRMQIPLLSNKQQKPPTRGLVSYFDEALFDKYVGTPLKKPTKQELDAEIESLVKVPKLSPLTEEMFAAIGARTPPASAGQPGAAVPPGAAANPPAPPAAPAPSTPGGPAASVAERPTPLPAVAPDPPPAAKAAAPPAGSPAPAASVPPPTTLQR